MFSLAENIAKSYFLACLFLIIVNAINVPANAAELSKASLKKSKIEYQFAAQFSALNWQSPVEPAVLVSIRPMKNYSGIPTNANKLKPEYYDHGKLPESIQRLFTDLALSTRVLETGKAIADIELQLTLDYYSHPFSYAPDDHWYKTLQDEVDRWAVTKNNAKVGLTLMMASRSHRFKPWLSSVQSTLSHCDLNANQHSLLPFNQTDEALSAYTGSAMGQAFISASNYLLLQAVEHLNSQQKRAQVVSSSHNQLLLSSEHNRFVTGEKYQLVFNHAYSAPIQHAAGSIQVVKSMGSQAVAYPVDLHPDHIKVGDWVEVGKSPPIQRPTANFVAKNSCATVGVAELESSDEGSHSDDGRSDESSKDSNNAG